MTQPILAREVHWTYWLTSEVTLESVFYKALEGLVAKEIRLRLQPGQPILWVGREMQLLVGNYLLHARLTNINPLLADTFDDSTQFTADYHERAKDEGLDISTFISEVIRYPNPRLGTIYNTLVGINHIQEAMIRKLTFLLKPDRVKNWLERYYPGDLAPSLQQALLDRYPLIILSGEVGSGKTALARSIGHPLSHALGTQLVLYIVNAQVRGGGHVGELTQNISRAFTEAELCQQREQLPVMLFIDEADALAQERGSTQTHHEDDAGVNTLIQRIDRLRGLPMAVIFATNLFNSIDRAVLRRATALYQFNRPNYTQRAEVFSRFLAPMGFSAEDIDQLAYQTNPRQLANDQFHSYTYSDIVQRIIPYAAEEAIRDQRKLLLNHLEEACINTQPTPETSFKDITILQNLFDPDSYLEIIEEIKNINTVEKIGGES